MFHLVNALSRFTKPLALLTLVMVAFSSIGCASTPGLTLTSIERHQSYRQNFTQAYTSRKTNGDIDVVLVDQAADGAIAPVRQVMHIRLLWSPTSDMKAVVSNASVKWYVIGRSNPQDILEYTGIAFVSMDEDEGTATLKVKNALLRPTGNRGAMVDPIGASRLEGSFVAHADAEKVDKVLKELKGALTAANSAAPALSSVR